MSYHGLGAGPGPISVYRLDMPFPWGDNTEVRVPVYAMVQDALDAVTLADTAALVPWDSINRRVLASIPVWVDEAIAQAQPTVDEYINRVTLRAALVGAAMVGGIGLVMWRMKR